MCDTDVLSVHEVTDDIVHPRRRAAALEVVVAQRVFVGDSFAVDGVGGADAACCKPRGVGGED